MTNKENTLSIGGKKYSFNDSVKFTVLNDKGEVFDKFGSETQSDGEPHWVYGKWFGALSKVHEQEEFIESLKLGDGDL